MDITWDHQRLPPARRALAVGNFDGVHVGHRALIDQLRWAEAELGLEPTVVTFCPHPLRLLRPDRAPATLEPLATRLDRLAAAGVRRAVVLTFDAALRDTTAEDFGRRLFDDFGAARIVASGDTRFGRGGAGSVASLRAWAATRGADVVVVPAVSREGGPASSSRVRRALAGGDLRLAAQLLDRPPCLEGVVEHGDKRGRVLGFPTANLQPDNELRPASGVYAGVVDVAGEGATGRWPAVANLGTRPSVGGETWRVEAHLLGFDGELYGQRLRLHLGARLRDERRFADLGELRAAIAGDAAVARAWWADARARGWPGPSARALAAAHAPWGGSSAPAWAAADSGAGSR